MKICITYIHMMYILFYSLNNKLSKGLLLKSFSEALKLTNWNVNLSQTFDLLNK